LPKRQEKDASQFTFPPPERQEKDASQFTFLPPERQEKDASQGVWSVYLLFNGSNHKTNEFNKLTTLPL
jgi:hypothetical protein